MKYYSFMIFTCFLIAIDDAKKLFCNSSQPFYLPSDEIFFIESLNYPEPPSSSCSMNFTVNEVQNLENLHLIFVITNNGNNFDGTLTFVNATYPLHQRCSFCFPSFLSITNYTEFTWDSRFAFQGMIIVDTWRQGCPLESVANINPYVFNDETEIIYLSSTYYDEFIDNGNTYNVTSFLHCSWRFAAPYGYKFKFVLTKYFKKFAILAAININGQTVNITDVSIPYYFDERYITFKFKTTWELDYFQGYLTIVKKVSDLVDGNCSIVYDEDGTTYWCSNGMDQDRGSYMNNAQCAFNISIPWENQILASTVTYDIEENVDLLRFYMSDKWIEVKSDTGILYLQAHENGYNDNILWEFISDGSVQKYGFRINFREKPCHCIPLNITVPCDDYISFDVMGDNFDRYCGNLRCNFSIKLDSSCNQQYIRLSFNAPESGGYYENDIARLYSNDIVFVNNLLTYSYNVIMVSSSRSFVLQFISYPPLTFGEKQFNFDLQAQTSSNPIKITLTKAKPTFELALKDIIAFSLINVKLDEIFVEENSSIEVFCQSFKNLIFYSDENLTHLLVDGNGLPSVSDELSFIFNKSVTVIGDNSVRDHHNSTLYFRVTKEHNKNCYLKKNVVYWTSNKPSISMVANEKGYCPFVVLFNFDFNGYNGEQVIISEIWSSSKNLSSKIYSGTGRFLCDFNSFNTWNRIYITSLFYTFDIPPNSGVTLKWKSVGNTWEISSIPDKILWISPSYDIETIYKSYTQDYYNITNSVNVKFTVLDFNVTSDTSVKLREVNSSDVLVNFTAVGQSFDITNLFVNLTFENENYQPLIEYNRVLIQIEAVDSKNTIPRL